MKKYKGVIFIILGISTFISFILFNISITAYQKGHDLTDSKIVILNNKIDSLEKVINTSFKNRIDTIVINTIPQQIKIYTTK